MAKENLVPLACLTDWDPIDEGHFGSVYKAKHTSYHVTVAVKKLKRDVPQDLKELISEAEKMASASASPYVIRLYGILEENSDRLPGIVMEYMKYGSLYTLMERVIRIPWPLKFRIIHQVTLGMNWLHNLPTPLLHLDLKTKNVLLTEDLHIKITDFGLSKYTRGSSNYGSEDCEGVGGTLEYMPPEAFQEGYQPSTSTDVYSFAILSAVVLRGENPYPVDKSELIRELVPRGQRPCLQALENQTSVKCLNEAIEFTKHCWDNDKLKRPPFSECCNKWETFFSAYDTCNIRQAVRQVQDEMDSSVFPGKTTNSYTRDAASINTELVQQFRTMNISEEPPVLLESAPVIRSTNTATRDHPQTSPQGPLQGAVGSTYRPPSTYYHEPVPVKSSPNIHIGVHPGTSPQGYPPRATGSNHRPQTYYYPGVPFSPHPSFPRYPYVSQPAFNFPQTFQPNTSTINISGSSNFQIGDNSIMNVTDKPYTGLYPHMSYRQPGHTMRGHYPTTTSPQPKQTAQGSYKMPTREVPSDQRGKPQTIVKDDQQSHICPVEATTEGHSSNAYNIRQVAQRSTSTIEKPTTKHPEQ